MRVSVIIFSLVGFCAFVLIPNWHEGPFAFLFFSTLIASQVFWIPRVVGLGELIRLTYERAMRAALPNNSFLPKNS
jgi:hypothetical protein